MIKDFFKVLSFVIKGSSQSRGIKEANTFSYKKKEKQNYETWSQAFSYRSQLSRGSMPKVSAKSPSLSADRRSFQFNKTSSKYNNKTDSRSNIFRRSDSKPFSSSKDLNPRLRVNNFYYKSSNFNSNNLGKNNVFKGEGNKTSNSPKPNLSKVPQIISLQRTSEIHPGLLCKNNFKSLKLDENLERILSDRFYFSKPTQIQFDSFNSIKTMNDVYICGFPSSGKTLAYLLPVINQLLFNTRFHERCIPRQQSCNKNILSAKVLIISPSKHLSTQIYNYCRFFSRELCLTAFSAPQILKLKNMTTCDFAITTPESLFKLVQHELLDLNSIQHFVLDEADIMLEDHGKLLFPIISKCYL